MNLADRIKNAMAAFAPQKNAMGDNLGRQFLKYGNNKALVQDWSKVVITDRELYTSYLYAAIRLRANRVAQLATENLITTAKPEIVERSKEKEEVITHPYIELIDSSPSFSNYRIWQEISTYLDLEGVYYLMAVRAVNGDRVGNIQEFKLLNPYEITRVVNEKTFEVGGYVQNKNGMQREIPRQMIIEMRELNPFDDDNPYAMTDAAKESQYTMKQAGDYTRHSIKNNIAAPGIISTDALLDDNEFRNFVSRVTNQEKGVPLFGNGAGAVSWDSMQIDMDKAALDKISEVNREALFAAAGVSKTMLGIEQSGVTRETGKVQSDLFVTSHVMPRLQMMIDAFNQDYKTYYESQYKANGYTLVIDNPLGSDKDAEMKDIDIRGKQYELYMNLVNKGYDREIAAKYASGEITLEEMGEPTNEPVEPPMMQETPPEPEPEEQEQSHDHDDEANHVDVIHNQFDQENSGLLNQQQSALQNAVINVEERVVAMALYKVSKNAFEDSTDVLSATDRKSAENELEIAIASFYGIILPLYASSVLSRRAKEMQLFGTFKINNDVKTYIKQTSQKAAKSHINTIVEDILQVAREASLEGKSQQELVSLIQDKYAKTISKSRAQTIARTETNRAFTMSQFQADKQFIKQNGLQGRAYKKWVTRSDSPCPFCLAKAEEPPIPFDNTFAEVGDELTVAFEENGQTKVRKQVVGFEDVNAGNLHPNCACTYQLIIE